MLHVTGNAQLSVLGHSRVELWSKGRLGPCVAQQEGGAQLPVYVASYVESFGATRTKIASNCVFLVFVCP